MRQIICDKCATVFQHPYFSSVNIAFGGSHKCSVDLCDTCRKEFGIEPSQYSHIAPDAGVRLLDAMREFIAENIEQ